MSSVNNRTVLDSQGAAVFKLSVNTNVDIGIVKYNLTLSHCKHKVTCRIKHAILEI